MNHELIRPNLHVVLVHFPMALLVMGVLIEVLSLIWRQAGFRSAGRWMILLGAIMAVPTCLSGLYALHDVAMDRNPDAVMAGWATVMQGGTFSGQVWELLEDHLVKMAVGTGAVLLIVVSWLGCSDRWRKRLYPIFLLVMMGTVGLFMLGAWHGGEAVYGQGVGVATVGNLSPGDHVAPAKTTMPAVEKKDIDALKKEVAGYADDSLRVPRPDLSASAPSNPAIEAPAASTVEPKSVPAVPETKADPIVPKVNTDPFKPEVVEVKPEVTNPAGVVEPKADIEPNVIKPEVTIPPEVIVVVPDVKPAAPATNPAPVIKPLPQVPSTMPASTKPATTMPTSMAPSMADRLVMVVMNRAAFVTLAAETEGAGDVSANTESHDGESDEDMAAFLPTPGSSTQEKVAFYVPPMQSHLIFAGLAVSMALISLGLSIRVAVNASARHRAELAQQELTGDGDSMNQDDDLQQANDSGVIHGELAEPITVTAPVPASRFWLLVFLLALVTMGLGWFALGVDAEAFNGDKMGVVAQNLWDMVRARDLNDGQFLNRRVAHVICGSAIILLPILMAILARMAPRKKILLTVFAVLMVGAIAAQIWMGMLLLLDGPKGPVTHMLPAEIVADQ